MKVHNTPPFCVRPPRKLSLPREMRVQFRASAPSNADVEQPAASDPSASARSADLQDAAVIRVSVR